METISIIAVTMQWQPGKDMELLLWEMAEKEFRILPRRRIRWENGEEAEMSRGVYCTFAGNLASSSV